MGNTESIELELGHMKYLFLFVVAGVLMGCGRREQARATPDASANKLFVEAVQLIASAEKETGEVAIKDYEQALIKLEGIIANYSDSDLAVKLIANETLFTGKSLKEIEERVAELKRVTSAISLQKRFLAGELTKADMEKVTSLSVGPNQLTDVKRLEKLTQLTVLHLFRNQLTDLKGLEKLVKLEELHLDGNQLTDARDLENLTKLESVYLNDNKLTSVKGLKKLAQLKELWLEDNPDLTKAQIDELKKALPKCKIISNPTK